MYCTTMCLSSNSNFGAITFNLLIGFCSEAIHTSTWLTQLIFNGLLLTFEIVSTHKKPKGAYKKKMLVCLHSDKMCSFLQPLWFRLQCYVMLLIYFDHIWFWDFCCIFIVVGILSSVFFVSYVFTILLKGLCCWR